MFRVSSLLGPQREGNSSLKSLKVIKETIIVLCTHGVQVASSKGFSA